MSTLTSFTLPLAAVTAFSRDGPSWRQGPHQVAQKSTITGVSREAASTAAAKLASVASLMRSAGGAAPRLPLFGVSPIRVMGSSKLFLGLKRPVALDGPAAKRLQPGRPRRGPAMSALR